MNDDNITRVRLDPENVSHGKTDWEKVEAMTEEEIDKAAEADSDCLPLSQQELNEFRRTSITDADLVVRSLFGDEECDAEGTA